VIVKRTFPSYPLWQWALAHPEQFPRGGTSEHFPRGGSGEQFPRGVFERCLRERHL